MNLQIILLVAPVDQGMKNFDEKHEVIIIIEIV